MFILIENFIKWLGEIFIITEPELSFCSFCLKPTKNCNLQVYIFNWKVWKGKYEAFEMKQTIWRSFELSYMIFVFQP